MSVVVNDAHLSFREDQKRRTKTTAIVLHHSAAQVEQTVEQLNEYYKAKIDRTTGQPDFIGIGYHYVIYPDGEIWKGREEWAVGGHAGDANGFSIGICFEGNYEIQNVMPDAQFNAGVALIKDICSRYGRLEIKKHCDYMQTACPGQYFPFDRIVQAADGSELSESPGTGKQSEDVPFPGAQFFGPGKTNDYILRLDQALIAKGYAKYYKYGAEGASRSWGNGTKNACRAFQLAQGWKGTGADGIPGPETWRRLGL